MEQQKVSEHTRRRVGATVVIVREGTTLVIGCPLGLLTTIGNSLHIPRGYLFLVKIKSIHIFCLHVGGK